MVTEIISNMLNQGNWKDKKRGPMSEDHKRKISLAKMGHVVSLESKKLMSLKKLGVPSKSKTVFGKKEKHPKWKGGVTCEAKLFRGSLPHQRFRKNIFSRDNNRCIWCGDSNLIEIHHIKSIVFFPELRLDETNAITLCHECHKKTSNYGKPKYYLTRNY